MHNLQNSSKVKVIRIAKKCADLVSRSTITHTVPALMMFMATGHKNYRDMLPLPLNYLKGLEYSRWPLVLSLYLLKHETTTNKLPHVFLHPTLVILATKIMVHFRATWMHIKMGAMELPGDLLSQIYRLGNHNPSPISKTTIRVIGLAFVTCIRPYLVPDGQYLRVLSLGLNHSAQ